MNIRDILVGIADAVRKITGRNGKMTLEQIAEIITDYGSIYENACRSGIIVPSTSGTSLTVSHKLGQEPGAVLFVKRAGAESSINDDSTTLYDALFSFVYGKNKGLAYSYNYLRKTSSASATTTTTKYWSNSSTVPSGVFSSSASPAGNYMTNINDASFYTPKNLIKGKRYMWIAFKDQMIS